MKNTLHTVLFLAALCIALPSCRKFLEKKRDIKLTTPETLTDLEYLLDTKVTFNEGNYPGALEIFNADYYVTYADFAARTIEEREMYTWAPNAEDELSWQKGYNIVFNANVALDNLPKISYPQSQQALHDEVKGRALFFRSFAFYHLAQLFCKPYNPGTASTDLGIVVRMTSDINVTPVRGTVQETYDRIIADLKEAASLLPVTVNRPTRPGKVAVFGALARTYLMMEEYEKAGRYADSALQLYSTLIDYNTLNASAANPMSLYNQEVIFHSLSVAQSIFSRSRIRVDSNLYKSYDPNDLRKIIYFQPAADKSYQPRADYGGTTVGATFFTGIVTDELYLTRAEAYARLENSADAMKDLNTLLATRWKKVFGVSTFVPYTAVNAEDALHQILKERRKELLFRGTRWPDLRRLNRDPRFATTLTRVIKDGSSEQTYTLPPNDKRYVLLIPQRTVEMSGLPQNER